MQIGGPKYPKNGASICIRSRLKRKNSGGAGRVCRFMVFVYGFSRFGVMLPLQEADRAEAVYAATEKELRTLEKSTRCTVRSWQSTRIMEMGI